MDKKIVYALIAIVSVFILFLVVAINKVDNAQKINLPENASVWNWDQSYNQLTPSHKAAILNERKLYNVYICKNQEVIKGLSCDPRMTCCE